MSTRSKLEIKFKNRDMLFDFLFTLFYLFKQVDELTTRKYGASTNSQSEPQIRSLFIVLFCLEPDKSVYVEAS